MPTRIFVFIQKSLSIIAFLCYIISLIGFTFELFIFPLLYIHYRFIFPYDYEWVIYSAFGLTVLIGLIAILFWFVGLIIKPLSSLKNKYVLFSLAGIILVYFTPTIVNLLGDYPMFQGNTVKEYNKNSILKFEYNTSRHIARIKRTNDIELRNKLLHDLECDLSISLSHHDFWEIRAYLEKIVPLPAKTIDEQNTLLKEIEKWIKENKGYLSNEGIYYPTDSLGLLLDKEAKTRGIPTDEYRKTHPWPKEPDKPK